MRCALYTHLNWQFCFAARHDLLSVPSAYQECTGPSFLSGMQQQISIDSMDSTCEI